MKSLLHVNDSQLEPTDSAMVAIKFNILNVYEVFEKRSSIIQMVRFEQRSRNPGSPFEGRPLRWIIPKFSFWVLSPITKMEKPYN